MHPRRNVASLHGAGVFVNCGPANWGWQRSGWATAPLAMGMEWRTCQADTGSAFEGIRAQLSALYSAHQGLYIIDKGQG